MNTDDWKWDWLNTIVFLTFLSLQDCSPVSYQNLALVGSFLGAYSFDLGDAPAIRMNVMQHN